MSSLRRLGVAAVACLAVLGTAATAVAAPPYDPAIRRTPYQPGPMLQAPTPETATGKYGYNMRGVRDGTFTYYEYVDSLPVALYINDDSSRSEKKDEEAAMKRLDRLMPDIVKEFNRWVGGRLTYTKYSGKTLNESQLRADRAIGVRFDQSLTSAKGKASPTDGSDARGAYFAGGIVRLAGGRQMATWEDLLQEATSGDKEARMQVYCLVMHEMGHVLGLAHYFPKFQGQYQLMSGDANVDRGKVGVEKILGAGDKAGLLAIAGFADEAKDCALKEKCTAVWSSGGVAWPKKPPAQ
jgi:hypothetical protein